MSDAEAQKEAGRWLANYHGSIDSTALVLAFEAGWQASRAPRPTDDDREVLANIIDWYTGDWERNYAAADKILAAGFRRGAPAEHTAPTDDREALAQVILAWAGPWEGPRKPSLLELLLDAGFRRGATTEHTAPADDNRGVPGFAEREKRAARAWEFFARSDREMSHDFRGGYHQGLIDGLRRAPATPAVTDEMDHYTNPDDPFWQSRPEQIGRAHV